MNLQSVDSILARMEALQSASRGEKTPAVSVNADGVDFSTMLRDAVREVNAAQNSAQAQAQAFQLGDRSVSIEQVMISMQQASLSFQGMVAVRNKLVEAYREISSLSVWVWSQAEAGRSRNYPSPPLRCGLRSDASSA